LFVQMYALWGVLGSFAAWVRACTRERCGGKRVRLPPLDPATLGTEDEKVIAYVQKIYAREDFREDPHAYMERWREERGETENYLYPQDKAQAILFGIVLLHRLRKTHSQYLRPGCWLAQNKLGPCAWQRCSSSRGHLRGGRAGSVPG
jgi:hypothetical protein